MRNLSGCRIYCVAKTCQFNELKQSHAKLIENTRNLLKSVDARDRPFVDGNEQIELLAELVVEPRAAAHQQIQVRRTRCLQALPHLNV